jgi:hypothetical protein
MMGRLGGDEDARRLVRPPGPRGGRRGDARRGRPGFCGRALARSHARSGDAAEIAGYLGDNDRFDQALGSFALAYADQTARDHAALVAAVRAGRVRASLPEPGLAGSPDLR